MTTGTIRDPGASARGQTADGAPGALQIDATADPRASPAADQVPVPDRPRLAEGIALKGEMSESAFQDPPWLIERNGRYVLVPRLLYAVAEHADGERDHEAMARAVSAAISRTVTADNIRQLVGNLVRMGIVLRPDGTSAVTESERGGDRARSPLAINMRMAMLSPRFIDPVTRVLQFFYWPPVLVACLAIAGLIQAWLYFVNGVGEGFRHAVYTPGLMLAVLGLVIVATAFHEFGHAAALRYGGGRVRGMGAGLYIVYPAFYTDVTDNYRLPRWSRVRTDLGGFYFNLLFAIGLMVAYVATGWEFLLLVIVILNLEIIYQLLPFVRLDGYWALADITGIPDFFSQIGPFLRSHLPSWVPLRKGRKMPPLKTWGRLFFAVYVLVTIPLLLFLLFLTVVAVPRIVATTIDAQLQFMGTLSGALRGGDWVTVLAVVLQMILITLPIVGLVFVFTSLGKRIFRAVRDWSAPSTGRKAVSVAGGVALVALLAFLWAPGLIVPGAGPGPIQGLIRFEPIRPGERFTVGEVVARGVAGATGEVLPSPGAPGGGAAPGSTAAPGTAPTPAPGLPGAPGATAQPGGAPGGPAPGATTGPAATAGPTAVPSPAGSPSPSPVP